MPKTFVTEALPFLETWLTHLFPTLQQPSISVAIIHGGKVAYKNAWGYANVEKKEKATPDHIYRIASHSKCITAFLIGMLVDEGTLNLDAPTPHLPAVAESQPSLC